MICTRIFLVITTLLFLTSAAEAQNTVTVSGKLYINYETATRIKGRIFLMTQSEHDQFMECAQNSSTSLPCIEKVKPLRETQVLSDGSFSFKNVPDGSEFYLIGIKLANGFASSMKVYVMGDTEQDIYMK